MSPAESPAPGRPLWRLISVTGEVARCYLEPLGEENKWLLTFWIDTHLCVSELSSSEAAAVARCRLIREERLSAGWSDSRVD